jgi:hypothetical protein
MLAFTRQLGARSGVQLNYQIDNTAGFAPSDANTAFGVMGNFTRGRTDKAFEVTRSNWKRFLGKGVSPSLDATHEVYLHLYEAFKKGASRAIIARNKHPEFLQYALFRDNGTPSTSVIASPDSTVGANTIFKIKYKSEVPVIIQITTHSALDNSSEEVSVVIKRASDNVVLITIPNASLDSGAGANYLPTKAATLYPGLSTSALEFFMGPVNTIPDTNTDLYGQTVSSASLDLWDAPDVVSYLHVVNNAVSAAGVMNVTPGLSITPGVTIFKMEHKENFNDGIVTEITFKKKYSPNSTTEIDSDLIRLRILDPKDLAELYSIDASIDPDAVDDFGNSIYLPNVAAEITDNLVFTMGDVYVIETTNTLYYGKTINEPANSPQILFVQGALPATNTELDISIANLTNNDFDYRYYITAGEQNVNAITKLATLAKEQNRPIMIDVDRDLTSVTSVLNWINGMIGTLQSQYCHIYWTPVKATDPVNGGKLVWGSSGMQVGYRCSRNARTDANGVPPMNFPIAGKAYLLDRNNITQVVFPTEDELNLLASNGINPVLFERYNSGSGYVFTDSLTNYRNNTSALNLIAVSDMAAQNDDWITKFGKECLQLPMADAQRRLRNFLTTLFEAEVAAGWITPSVELDGASFVFNIQPNAQRPFDRLDLEYSLHYDGTLRALYVQQTISK